RDRQPRVRRRHLEHVVDLAVRGQVPMELAPVPGGHANLRVTRLVRQDLVGHAVDRIGALVARRRARFHPWNDRPDRGQVYGYELRAVILHLVAAAAAATATTG